jgi:hypothetical protein
MVMTNAEIGLLMLGAGVLMALFSRKKPAPPKVFFEVREFVIRRPRKRGSPLVNLAIIAFFVLLVWANSHR